MKQFILFLLTICTAVANAQSDFEEQEQNKPQPNAGLYLNFENFITNRPVPPEAIETNLDRKNREFYFLLIKERKITFRSNDSTITISPANLWGYSDGKVVNINREVFPKKFFSAADISFEQFARVNFLSTLSLIHYVKVVSGNTNPELSSPRASSAKPVQFIMDTRNGNMYEATLSNLEKLLADDPELLNEFKKHKKDKDVKLYIFLYIPQEIQ
jgi:hypothetical protein